MDRGQHYSPPADWRVIAYMSAARKIEAGEQISLADIEYLIREAKAQAELKKALRQAVLDGNTLEVLRLAREITGLAEDVRQ